MEGHALHQPVLAGFRHFQAAAFEDVVESYGGGLAADDGHALAFLGFILVNRLLGYGINAGIEVGDVDLARLIGGLGGAVSLAGNGEADPGYLSILGSFNQLHIAGRCSHIQMGSYPVGIFHASHDILQIGITISNQLGALAYCGDIISAGGDPHGAADGMVCTDCQRIAGLCKGHAAVGAGEIILRQHSVGIGQGRRVLSILIVQINTAAIHKTGDSIVALKQGNDLVINGPGPGIWMVFSKVERIYGGIQLFKRTGRVSVARHKLPYQRLGGKPLFIVIP